MGGTSDARIERLLQRLNPEEKARLAAGSDASRTVGFRSLGIGRVMVTDGPNGARGSGFISTRSACFPCGSALAATWHAELVREVGQALGLEAQAKACQVLLAPMVNLVRSPLGGRGFECYGEDPWLAARIAVAFISGVQARGVAACAKHFVCNEFETQRKTANAEVDERALRELYLPPFEAAVKEAGVWTVMAAYNRLNGTFCSEQPLLNSVLKDEWGFEGLVMSDWWGTHSAVDSILSGLDLEMPGPPAFRGERLLEAVRTGEASAEVVDEVARRVLRLAERTGVLDNPEERPERSDDRAEHRALARRTAAEAMVLLQNRNRALPLDAAGTGRMAVIGPFAHPARPQGGGSAEVNPYYTVSPLEGLRNAAPPELEIVFEPGCSIEKGIPVLQAPLLAGSLHVDLFGSRSLDGPVTASQEALNGRLVWVGEGVDRIVAGTFLARITGTLEAQTPGRHVLSLASVGRSRLYAGGQMLIDNWTRLVH